MSFLTFNLKHMHFLFPSNNCHTSIVDYHRSCTKCSYDLCLRCCQELREGHVPGGAKEAYRFYELSNVPGKGHNMNLNNQNPLKRMRFSWERQKLLAEDEQFIRSYRSLLEWRTNVDGSIPCPPKDCGGCGNGLLSLKRNFKCYSLNQMLKSAEYLTKRYKALEEDHSLCCAVCPSDNAFRDDGLTNSNVRRAAFREDSHDNLLYCPRATDMGDRKMQHFRWHWLKGEPVIVRSVLENTSGLSWEPMVMWRAIGETKTDKFGQECDNVRAIDCLNCCEVNHFPSVFFFFFTLH